MNEKTSFDGLGRSVEGFNELTMEELPRVLAAFNKLGMERIARTAEDVSMLFDGPDIEHAAANFDTTTEAQVGFRGGM